MFTIGYSINKKSFYRLKFRNLPIGMYGLTFQKKSHYIYKALGNCNGYFIRRVNWKNILESEMMDDHFLEHLKRHI